MIISCTVFQFATVTSISAQIFNKSFQVENRKIDVKEFNAKVEEIIDKAEIPGLSLAVIDRNEVVFFNTYGYKEYKEIRNGEFKPKGKVNKKTVFEGCSLSKSFFVFAVHRLVDQGILNLDTPLYHYLEHPRLKHDDRYLKITGYMVLTHSSGIENWQYYNNPDTLEILTEPGEAHIYSGEGYMYLAEVVAKLLGKSIESYMEDLVYDPLKLKSTFTTFKNNRALRNYSVGHDSFKKPQAKHKNKDVDIAGRISTTAKDYGQVLIGIFGGDYLSKERLNHLTGGGIYMGEDPAGNIHKYGPGFAFFIDQAGDTIVYQYGDNGAFKGFGGYNVTRDAGFVFFSNGVQGDKIRGILQELIFDIKEEDITQYPNEVLATLNMYNEQGYMAALNYLRNRIQNDISKYELEELSELFLNENSEFSAYISGEIISRSQEDQRIYVLHGKAMMKNHKFKEALVDFEKALELDDMSSSDIEELIAQCREQLKKEEAVLKE
ncbi:hypothetical protein C900_01692 [Fulvivirga imtechensis AK7]|uniref:Beta-lactamase-related domain-containing protein n=1 Tax=Fulvivirga imtechensis AK7 TaxID=1237149 RepID=L8JYL0_9BACT|nr:hypothetical protein C900_01692 [Fulvivirga imtechensis AK7]